MSNSRARNKERKLPVIFCCYSDASFVSCHSHSGYAYVVVKDDGESQRIHRKEKGSIMACSNIDAELIAMVKALKCIPDNSAGYLNSDLRDIEHIVNQRTGQIRKTTWNELQFQLIRTGLEPRYLDSRERPHHYRECHRLARRAIGLYTI